jgi:hypothetical protein
MLLSETMTELRDDGHRNVYHVEPLWEGSSALSFGMAAFRKMDNFIRPAPRHTRILKACGR